MKDFTILLIDDDEASNFLHRIIIEDSAYEATIEECLSARDGLNFLKMIGVSENFAQAGSYLVLLDINMPEMSAWDFLEEYKTFPHELKSKVVIVINTTSFNPDDLSRSKQIECVRGFYNKPLTNAMLKEIITNNF